MAITVKELIEQLSKYRPEAEVGMHFSLEGVVRVGQAEGMVVLYVESEFDCPRCEEEEADCARRRWCAVDSGAHSGTTSGR